MATKSTILKVSMSHNTETPMDREKMRKAQYALVDTFINMDQIDQEIASIEKELEDSGVILQPPFLNSNNSDN